MKQGRLIVLVLFGVLFIAACATATPTAPPPPPTKAPAQSTIAPAQPTTAAAGAPILKLSGPSGQKALTMAEIKALTVSQGWAGIKSSTGKITIPEQYKGVSIAELGKLVGGIQDNMGITLTAKDGYAMTISSDQVTKPGGFITYDPGTGDEIKYNDPLTAILAYEKGGQPLPADSDGPLKLVVISTKNTQIVDGHWAVKWINEISIKTMALDWKLPLGGAIAEEMDRGTYQSCAATSCHGRTWTDGKANVYTGVPLYLLAGRVDDEIKHGENSYNETLAQQGYPVHVVSVDGTRVSFDSLRVNRNGNILVAYLVNNNPLDDKDGPLKLVGSDLKPDEAMGRISKINLMLTAAQTSTVTATVKATIAATSAATAAPTAKPTTAATSAATAAATKATSAATSAATAAATKATSAATSAATAAPTSLATTSAATAAPTSLATTSAATAAPTSLATTSAATAAATKATSAATPAATAAATSSTSGTSGAALTVTGEVDKPLTLTLDAVRALPTAKITAEHPKQGKQDYTGVRFSTLFEQAKIKDAATKLVLTSTDNFKSEVTVTEVKKCADCMLAIDGTKLNAVMPGMISSFWAKDVAKIEVK